MKFRELTVLLPCHSLEDFPIYQTGEAADSLLSSWTALWHPALVAASGCGPKWHRVDLPPEDLAGMLILVPTVSATQLPAGFSQRAKEAGALLVMPARQRDEIFQRALANLDSGDCGIDSDLVADFLALGFAYLQVSILTRQMRNSSNLNEYQFFQHVVAGSVAAVQGNGDEARQKLTAAFDLLAAERDHYYSVDAFLLDLTLVAETTMGSALREELAGAASPLNLLVSGDILAAMADREPDSVRAIQEALSQRRLGLIGGEFSELPLPLRSCESILADLRRGDAAYRRYLGRRVDVFGRRRFGLTPILPGILEKLQFTGALHATLDDGHFPAGSQIKTRWQGVDAGVIDAIAKPPLDATLPETFLSYARKLSESMDSDLVATLCLAHWPRQVSPWWEDLRRCSRYTSALGKFITVDDYFRQTYQPTCHDRFDADQYKSPYLKQAVIRKHLDPISSIHRYWVQCIAAGMVQGLEVMAASVKDRWSAERESSVGSNLAQRVDGANRSADSDLDQQLATAVEDSVRGFVNAISKRTDSTLPGYLIANPFGFTRRVGVEVRGLANLPVVERPVIATGNSDDRQFVVVDLPAMGYTWLSPGDGMSAAAKSHPPLAQDDRAESGVVYLRNEYFEATIDPVTGVLRSLHDYQSRQNRLAQQLALRVPGRRGEPGETWQDPDETAQYSVMAADEVTVSLSNPAVGEVTTRGRLLDRDGQVQAEFGQVFRVWRGSRVLQLEVELHPVSEPASDAWTSYYACRFAWSDESATLFASVNQTRQPVQKQRLEAPLYVDVESGEARTTILTGGMPFHRRVGSRMLDSLLVVRGERESRFRLGIGVDLPYSLPEALSLLAPAESLIQSAVSPACPHSWLFHLDARAVVPTHWSPLEADGKVCGVRVRLLESSGRSGRLTMSAFRPFRSGRQVNFLGETLVECSVTDGRINVDISAHEWLEIEGRWS